MNGFLDLEILMVLHLSGWKAIPHFFSHTASWFKSSCSRSQSCWLLILLYRIQSSANNRVFDWTQSGRSLVKSKNSNGSTKINTFRIYKGVWGLAPEKQTIFLKSNKMEAFSCFFFFFFFCFLASLPKSPKL